MRSGNVSCWESLGPTMEIRAEFRYKTYDRAETVSTMHTLLSVVIAVYNDWEPLDECLQSLAHQKDEVGQALKSSLWTMAAAPTPRVNSPLD